MADPGPPKKGKAKVTDIKHTTEDEETNASGELADDPAWPATFIIKFSDDSLEDLTIEVGNVLEVTVSELKRQIRKRVAGITQNRRLRLIHSGRVINDQTDLAKDVAKVNLGGQISRVNQPVPRIYIHCSIGDILSAQELARENELDSKVPTRSTLPELRGFDRLRATGFTEEDVAQLRQQFNALYGTGSSQNPEEATQLEEQWIDTGAEGGAGGGGGGAGGGGAGVVLGGDYLDDLVGILIGMFLGVIVLFVLKESSALSPRQQRALVAGVSINFSFAVMILLM